MSDSFSIHSPYHAFYIEDFHYNCSQAFAAVSRVKDTIAILSSQRLPSLEFELRTDTILNSLQTFILHAGNISKYFWTNQDGKKNEYHNARASYLRSVFEVDDGSVLRDRALRNSIEHFAERLDSFTQDLKAGEIIPNYVGSRHADDGVPRYYFRAFFTQDNVFQILDEKIAINPIIEELNRVHMRLGEFINGGMVF
jgi:hypothetical protein